jgi:tetratricopeptide (TPR) repeat protein
MKNMQILAVLLFFCCAINAQNTLERAKVKFENRHYNRANSLLKKYIASEKDTNKLAEGYFWLGECSYQKLKKRKPDEAIQVAHEQFKKGFDFSKKSPHCFVGMGKLLLDKKNDKEALKSFDMAVRYSKTKSYKEANPDIYMLIGDMFLNCTQPNIEQAIANYTRARDIEPNRKDVWEKMNDPKILKYLKEQALKGQ